MICKKCGKEISEGSQFCTYCGEKVEEEKERGQNDSREKKIPKKRKMFKIILCLIIVIVICKIIKGCSGTNSEDSKEGTNNQIETVDKSTTSDSDSTTTSNKKIWNNNDLEQYMGKNAEKAVNERLDFEPYIGYYGTSDETVKLMVDSSKNISKMEIKASEKYSFHGIKYGMDLENIKKLLSNGYQYSVRPRRDVYFWKPTDDEMSYEWEYGLGGIISLDENNTCINIQVVDDITTAMRVYRSEMKYIVFDDIYRKLREEDIENLSLENQKLIESEIYVREGMIPSDSDIYQIFNVKDWYDGVIKEEQFDKNALSDIEKYNIQFVNNYIKQKNDEMIKTIEESNRVTTQDILGTFKDEANGYKLIVQAEGDITTDSATINYQIIKKDQSLFAKVDGAYFENETVSGPDYDFIINDDKTITIKTKDGKKIGTFKSVIK